jgi:hypothetical protein
LNFDIVKFVFSNYREFYNFTLISTDTTKKVEYFLIDLRDLFLSVARRFFAFNCRIEAMRLIINVIFIDDFPYKKIIFLDFTVFSFAFTEIFENSILKIVNMVDLEG